MKNIYKTLLVVVVSITLLFPDSYGQGQKIAIIPEPVQISEGVGFFKLPEIVTVNSSDNKDVSRVAQYLSEAIKKPTGREVDLRDEGSRPTIHLVLNQNRDNEIGDEGYRLSVKANGIVISANKPSGLFYGTKTLLQLFPKEIESSKRADLKEWEIPIVEIKDYPRFGWRGLMFDVARHFFDKADVEQFIDEMVRYKFNLLHLHLTDDQGWRVEIKGLSKLTEIGAWNVKKVGTFGTFSKPAKDAERNYGGFFTQKDIKEIVQYAKDRFVNILPEIDVPAHSLAAIASYPELSCTADAVNYQVNSGESFMDWSHGAPPIALEDNTMCPANEEVYTFLDKVLTQIAQLFPFEYIDLGGDEAPHNFWEKSPQIKALMKRENLKTMDEVQSYFTKRVEKIVESKGKKLIGWDEILQGGIAPNAAVMSWRGIKGGEEAARLGHKVVMSPNSYVYLDLMQGDAFVEPPVYSTVLLSKTYQFDPVPPGVDPKFILGGQGNLWSEQVYNMRHAEYMLWPRGLAVAEAVWSPMSRRNWTDFIRRMEDQFTRMEVAQIKYATSVYEPVFKPRFTKDNRLEIELDMEIKGLDIYYSFDNSYPDNFYPKYDGPLEVPVDARLFRVVTYENGVQKGRMISIPIKDLENRARKKK